MSRTISDYTIQNPILLKSKKIGKKSTGTWYTLILRPAEFKEIIKNVNRKYEVIFYSLLLTGMRYEELYRFRQHPEWFDGNFIHLPSDTGQKKVKRHTPERWIRLSIAGKIQVKSLFDIELPKSSSIINQYLYYNFPNIKYLGVKTFRKTWESWLVFYFSGKSGVEIMIAESQGHTTITQFHHYLNMPFTEKDKMEMREFVEGWV